MTWQPIKTAPCGTPILVLCPDNSIAVAELSTHYGATCWHHAYSTNVFKAPLPFTPDHWCPIPDTSTVRAKSDFYAMLRTALDQCRGNVRLLEEMQDWSLRKVADTLAPNGIRMVFMPEKRVGR